MTLSPGAKVQPNRSTLRSPAGLRAACSSMLDERAPTPPRFMDVANGIEAEAARDAGLHEFDDSSNCGLRVVSWREVEVAVRSGWTQIRDPRPGNLDRVWRYCAGPRGPQGWRHL